MKILIILATLLLVPIVMKFQQQTLERSVVPGQVSEIEKILAQGGVSDGRAKIRYMDATIYGEVENWSLAEKVTQDIALLPGIRRVENELSVRGNLKLERRGGKLIASGMLPPAWREPLLQGQPQVDAANLRERETTTYPLGKPLAWGLFIDQFFLIPGERTVVFDGEILTLSGEATPSFAKSIAAEAVALGGSDTLRTDFVLYPSLYHFPSRDIQSPIGGEALRVLQLTLLEGGLSFSADEATLDAEGLRKLGELSAQLLEGNSAVRLIIGGYFESLDSALALRRARMVQRQLVAQGLPSDSLEVAVFEMTEDSSGFLGQVEVLLR